MSTKLENLDLSSNDKFLKFADGEEKVIVFINDEIETKTTVFEGGKYRAATDADSWDKVTTKYVAAVATVEGGKRVEKTLEQSKTFFSKLQAEVRKGVPLVGTRWSVTRVGTGKSTAYLIRAVAKAAPKVVEPTTADEAIALLQ